MKKNSRSKGVSVSPVVLVGTYRKENSDWIQGRGLYNLPLPEEGETNFHRGFTHVVLVSGDSPILCRQVNGAREVDMECLKGEGYRQPGEGVEPHGRNYMLYSLGADVDADGVLSDPAALVYVCSTRFTGRIDADFYSRQLPDCGGRSIPNIFRRLKPYFAKWRGGWAFNPVQLDFLDELDIPTSRDVPFPAPTKPRFTFIDLFAGIGGIRLGYQSLGGKCVFSSEWDRDAAKTYAANFGETPHGDITKIDAASIPDFDVLLGGFPCQPFSIIGDKEGFRHETQGTLFFDIERILLAKRPKAFMLENVRNLTAHDGGRTFKVILSHLREAGYDVHAKVLNALDYGVPQKRERIIICGFRTPVPDFEFPPPLPPSERKTVADIVDSTAEGDKSLFVRPEIRASRLARLRNKDFPRPYISHENVAGSITPHNYSCALRAGASANYILVNDERRPSARELLRIQGFPDEFRIVVGYGKIRHQTGNSVAVPVIRAVAERVVAQLDKIGRKK